MDGTQQRRLFVIKIKRLVKMKFVWQLQDVSLTDRIIHVAQMHLTSVMLQSVIPRTQRLMQPLDALTLTHAQGNQIQDTWVPMVNMDASIMFVKMEDVWNKMHVQGMLLQQTACQ
jgi:hypothetical protein